MGKNEAKKLILFDIDKTLIKKMERTKNPWPDALKKSFGLEGNVTISLADTHGKTHKQIAFEAMKERGLKENKIKESDVEDGSKQFMINFNGSGVDSVGDRYYLGIAFIDDPFINMISRLDEIITG